MLTLHDGFSLGGGAEYGLLVGTREPGALCIQIRGGPSPAFNLDVSIGDEWRF